MPPGARESSSDPKAQAVDDTVVRSEIGRSWLVPPQSGQLAPPTLASLARSQDRTGLPAPVQILEVCGVVRVKAWTRAGRLVFCGVSVLTFDSKSRRAISGLDKTPGCGWGKWQGLASGACERDGGEEIVDGGAASDSGGIHPGVQTASSSGAGVLDCGRRGSLRGSCWRRSWSPAKDVTARAVTCEVRDDRDVRS